MNCDALKCLTCIDGYQVDNTKKCSLCSSIYNNCVNCNATTCTECQVGYTWDSISLKCNLYVPPVEPLP
jgi:hypothetical protein